MKIFNQRMRLFVALLLGLAGGCDQGGGDDPSGRSTIMGTVVSFPGTDAARQRAGGLQRAANGAGVTVSVVGTDLSGTTADDGTFVISGVPAGAQVVEFARDGFRRSTGVEVPEHGVVHLDGVRVDDRGVDVQHSSTDVAEDSQDDHGTDGSGHDVGDDHGTDGAGHDAGDDHGVDGPEHDAQDDHGGGSSGGHGGGDDDGAGHK